LHRLSILTADCGGFWHEVERGEDDDEHMIEGALAKRVVFLVGRWVEATAVTLNAQPGMKLVSKCSNRSKSMSS
jgi:hypothetical protein